MLTVYNHDKVRDGQLHIPLAKGYGQKLVQPLKTMIYVAESGREAIFLCFHGSGKQGKIDIKIRHLEVITDSQNKKDSGQENSTLGELVISV